ncbi:MAG TPA: SDR family NAD(P)-dependent oxidoreductase [Ruminiclostridium sp.]|nr:SDR family NAD(P)-dependent oxidoreductase [Ruminiclostridium sp.]
MKNTNYAAGDKLNGKIAVVTGASSGIGKEIAKLFICQGAKVAAVSRGISEDIIYELKRDIPGLSDIESRIHIFPCDVGDEIQVKAAVEGILNRFGSIDILVNSAGITNRTSVVDCNFDGWNEVIATNLSGSFLFSHHAAQHMINRGSGNIVLVSSIGSYMSWCKDVAYQSSKGGMTSMCRSMAVDLADYGIRVNCVCPGLIDAPMLSDVLKNNDPDGAIMEKIIARVPLGRLGTANEVAKAVLFLASDDSTFITGSTLVVDGGYTIHDN